MIVIGGGLRYNAVLLTVSSVRAENPLKASGGRSLGYVERVASAVGEGAISVQMVHQALTEL
jgi:hypothetical protein